MRSQGDEAHEGKGVGEGQQVDGGRGMQVLLLVLPLMFVAGEPCREGTERAMSGRGVRWRGRRNRSGGGRERRVRAAEGEAAAADVCKRGEVRDNEGSFEGGSASGREGGKALKTRGWASGREAGLVGGWETGQKEGRELADRGLELELANQEKRTDTWGGEGGE